VCRQDARLCNVALYIFLKHILEKYLGCEKTKSKFSLPIKAAMATAKSVSESAEFLGGRQFYRGTRIAFDSSLNVAERLRGQAQLRRRNKQARAAGVGVSQYNSDTRPTVLL
jgi:hypothetical protein